MPSSGAGGGRLPGDVGSVDADHARHRADEAGDRPERRGLAGAVGSEQGDDLAGIDVQVEVPQDRGGVVSRREAVELEDGNSSHQPADSSSDAAAPRYAVTTLGSARTSVGVPRAITLPNSITTTWSQIPSTSPMSWSMRSVGRASVDDLAQVPAERDGLLRVEPGGRLVEAEELGAGGQRPGDGHELPLALGELAGRHVREGAECEHVERLVHRLGTVDRPAEELGHHRAHGRVVSGDGEVLPHGQVVEQLDGLPRPGEALPGAGVRRQPGDVGAVQLDGPPMRHEAGDGVDEGRLPGAVRADEADQLAGLDVEVDVDDGVHAAERHRDAAGREHAHDSLTAAARPPGPASGPTCCSRSASASRTACASAAATSFARLAACLLR